MRNKKYTIIGIAVALWICIVGFIGFRVYRSSQQYSDWIQQAAAYEQEGKYEEALISYAMASSIKPKKAEPYIKMAEIYEDQGDYDDAASILRIGSENIGSSFLRKSESNQLASAESDFYGRNEDNNPDPTKTPDIYQKTQETAENNKGDTQNDLLDEIMTEEQGGTGNTFSAMSNGEIYYTGQDGIYTVQPDGSDNKSVKEIDPSAARISDFQISNRMAYYLEAKDTSQDGVYDYSLCTMNLDTGEEDVLYEMDALSDASMKMDEDTIYVASRESSSTDMTAGLTDPEVKIETLSWNEEDQQYDDPAAAASYEGTSTGIYVQNKKIYYSQASESGDEMLEDLCQYDMESKDTKSLSKGIPSVHSIMGNDKYIYYYAGAEESKTYAYNLDTEETETVADEALNNVCGTSLYLSANDDSQTEVKLYCQNEDDSKKDTLTTIENDGQYSVDVVGDKMLICIDHASEESQSVYLADLDGNNMKEINQIEKKTDSAGAATATESTTETTEAADTESSSSGSGMKAAYQKVLDDTYSKYKNQGGKYLEYHVYDADQDGAEELIVRNGTCEADYMWKIYTYDGGRAVLLDTFAGGHTSLYVCSSGGFYCMQAHMGNEAVYKYTLSNGNLSSQKTYEANFGEDESKYKEPGDGKMPQAYITDSSLLDSLK